MFESILLQLTTNCNLQCRHCCYECGPKGRTMSAHDLGAVFGNIPLTATQITVSGGEVFTEPEILRRALSYIKSKKWLFPLADIAVQTNGFWAKEESDVCDTLEELCRLGVDVLAITSIDKYHKEQGLDTSRLEMKQGSIFYNAVMRFAYKNKAEMRLEERSFGDIETTIVKPGLLGWEVFAIEHKGADGNVMPFGRAKYLPATELKKRTSCGFNPKTKEDMGITIAADGNMYPCCWKVSAPMGSAIETPVRQIVSNAKKDRVLGALMAGGPKEAAKAMGVYNPKDEFTYRRNPCVMCREIFRGAR